MKGNDENNSNKRDSEADCIFQDVIRNSILMVGPGELPDPDQVVQNMLECLDRFHTLVFRQKPIEKWPTHLLSPVQLEAISQEGIIIIIQKQIQN